METLVVVVAAVAMIAVGAFLIHRLNSQHDTRATDFHYGPFGSVLRGPAPSVPRRKRGRTRPPHRTRRGPRD
ncbi:hypothetical protein [Streptomyces sp. DH24]|uniref:hypothetical protein n=1 Tax=Streptomyces sp. DH24 TaxID=3040123 RepID=UPI002442D0A6|nr:hypothetical protein [Streptomyces sp. DH24]MDG9715447.1 hypothetical protein [Streptomyces sp. DH24]